MARLTGTILGVAGAFAVGAGLVLALGLVFRDRGPAEPETPTKAVAAATKPASQPATVTAPLPPPMLTPPWPVYRGDAGLRGVAPAGTELPDAPVLRWKFKTEDPVHSSAVVAEGRVFVGSGDKHVYALDLGTGQRLWAYQTEDAVEAPPALLFGRLYVGSDDGNLYCLEPATGKLRWKFKAGDKVMGAATGVKAPTGEAEWVLFGSYDNYLYCVNAADGKEVWKYETGNYINGAPALVGVDTFGGAGGPGASGGAKPRVIFGGCDGIVHILDLAKGSKVGQVEAGGYVAASPAVVGERAYVGHMEKEFLCIDLAGQRVVWRYKDRNFEYYASAAVDEKHVVFGARDKRVHCADPRSGRPLWTFATRGHVDSSPVIVGDKVVVGSSDGRLYILGLNDGKERWSFEIGADLVASPAVAGPMIVIGSEDGSVYGFGPKP